MKKLYFRNFGDESIKIIDMEPNNNMKTKFTTCFFGGIDKNNFDYVQSKLKLENLSINDSIEVEFSDISKYLNLDNILVENLSEFYFITDNPEEITI